MSEQLNRIEEMLGQLIKMVGATNAEVKETKDQVTRVEQKIDKLAEGNEHHEHGIDILNRKLFRLETEVEKIKSK